MTETELNELKAVLRKAHELWEGGNPRNTKNTHKARCVCGSAYSGVPPACSAFKQMIWWHTSVWRLRTAIRFGKEDVPISVRYFSKPEVAYAHINLFITGNKLQMEIPVLDPNNPKPVHLFSATGDADVKLTVHKVD